MSGDVTLTPAMQQYVDTKKEYPDCVLLFRIGDFYETFFEDARICAKELDLIITSKNKNADDPIPMAGIPHHSIDKYLPRLTAANYKVAIAEQVGDIIPGKVVKRCVTRIITPGTAVFESQNQDAAYIVGITMTESKKGSLYHIARGDFMLGEYLTKTFDDVLKLQKFVVQLRPKEVILDRKFPLKDDLTRPFTYYINSLVSLHEVPDDVDGYLLDLLHTQNLLGYGKALQEGRGLALALLFSYIQYTQKSDLKTIAKVGYHSSEGLVLMDEVTIKNLEIFSSSYEGNVKYSLFSILNNTKTAGGSRLLHYILSTPIYEISELERRLSYIDYFVQSSSTKGIYQFLGNFADIPKLLTLISYRRLTWVPFSKLRSVLYASFYGCEGGVLGELKKLGFSEEMKISLGELLICLQRTLKEDEKLYGDENYIADGVDSEIDSLRKLAFHSDELLLEYQQELVKLTNIQNIKLKYVTNQGCFIELSSKDSDNFEEFFRTNYPQTQEEIEKFSINRRQTLKGNQRYSSPYLDKLQSSILEAKDKLAVMEFSVLQKLQEMVIGKMSELYSLANSLAWLDVFVSHAILVKEKGYTKPTVVDSSLIEIQGGRHPVIEGFLQKDTPFIPNSLVIGDEKSSHNGLVHIITGPNMGGKSTFLRQNALIVLLAHCGLYVPAQSAKIGLIDGIFARVGSGDIIAKNQSTFMTEMIEVSNILNNATEKSFIIFDELGRGTSTYDGLALTKAILHYILEKIHAKTLIATHYHELIALEKESSFVRNFSVGVYDNGTEVVFMKKIIKGGASKSYGIHVAKLAGIPESVQDEAKRLLLDFENQKKKGEKSFYQQPVLFSQGCFSHNEENQHEIQYEKFKALLSGLDLDNITPIQALQILIKLKGDFN